MESQQTFVLAPRASEEDLVERFKLAVLSYEAAKEAAIIAKDERDRAEYDLSEHLLASGVDRTDPVTGVGYAKFGTPKITASVAVGDMDKAIELFREMKRDRDIKTVVSPSGLASFVRSQLLSGDEVPAFIKHHVARSVQIVGEISE